LREDNEIFREFVKEKADTLDLINSKVRKALTYLDTIEGNEECNKAKLILCQCIILTNFTVMSEDEVEHLKHIITFQDKLPVE